MKNVVTQGKVDTSPKENYMVYMGFFFMWIHHEIR